MSRRNFRSCRYLCAMCVYDESLGVIYTMDVFPMTIYSLGRIDIDRYKRLTEVLLSWTKSPTVAMLNFKISNKQKIVGRYLKSDWQKKRPLNSVSITVHRSQQSRHKLGRYCDVFFFFFQMICQQKAVGLWYMQNTIKNCLIAKNR